MSVLRPVLTITVLLGLLAAAADGLSAEVYRWTDEEGNVIFSDTPHEGAVRIELGETTVVPAQRVPPPREREPRRADQRAAGYESVRITSPPDQATLRNVQSVTVKVATTPPLQTGAGHRLQLYYDGNPYGEPATDRQFAVQPLYRGEHRLSAAVVDAEGRELARSEPVVIYVHQTSKLHPPPASPAGP